MHTQHIKAAVVEVEEATTLALEARLEEVGAFAHREEDALHRLRARMNEQEQEARERREGRQTKEQEVVDILAAKLATTREGRRTGRTTSGTGGAGTAKAVTARGKKEKKKTGCSHVWARPR